MTIALETRRGLLIAGRAELVAEDREVAWAETQIKAAPDLAWITGNFVCADTPNYNGHIFPLEDLRTAHTEIPYRPLNLMHRGQSIVGVFVGTQLQYPTQAEQPVAAEAAASPQVPFVDSLSAFYKFYFPDTYKEVQKAHAEGHLALCVDDDTEIMTVDGWKTQRTLAEGELILTLNTDTHHSEFLPVEKIYREQVQNQEMVHMDGMMHSSLTTPNHRWWVERKKSRGGRVREWRTSESLTQMTKIPRAVPFSDFPAEPKYSDAFVELVAWWWTEGHDTGCAGNLSQSHGVDARHAKHTERITQCLKTLYGPPSRVRDGEGGLWYSTTRPGTTGERTEFHLCQAGAAELRTVAPNCEPLPSFLLSLTKAQLLLYIRVSLDGDGTVASTDGQMSLTQSAMNAGHGWRQIRSFEMACALAGVPTNTTYREYKTTLPGGKPILAKQWRVCLIRRSDWFNPIEQYQRKKGFKVERVRYDGTIWCPSTPNGTFLARRRGTVFWTGNSMEAVPKTLTCAGNGDGSPGCGRAFAYQGRQDPSYCEHLNAPGAHKLMNKPRFTAGALVLPPARPAWKDADVTQLARYEDTDQLEAAYTQVATEFPHLDAVQWERIMAQLLAAAEAA